MPRKLKKILTLVLSLAVLISANSHANERKPAKENPANPSSNSGVANRPTADEKSGANTNSKSSDPVPAPSPTSQPVEVNQKQSVPTNTGAGVEQSKITSSSPVPVKSIEPPTPSVKPEPTKTEATKPADAKPETVSTDLSKKEAQGNQLPTPTQSNKEVGTTSISESTTPKEKPINALAKGSTVVVNPTLFKSKKLLAGAFAPGLVNASAKELLKSEPASNCGVVENKVNLKSSGSAKSAAVQANQGQSEKCMDYLLVFSDDSTDLEISNAAAGVKGKIIRKFTNVFKGILVNGPPSKILALAKNPKIQAIEVDGKVKTQEIYSNPVWGLDRSDQRQLPLDATFDDLNNSGLSIPIYIVDTGIYADHSEYAGRVAAGATSISDGYGTWDCNGHGTHVAGTAAGRNYGIAKSATLIPVRVLDCNGSGSYSDVIAGLDWIAANHPIGVPGVVNMSLGGPTSSSLDSAVKSLISRGLTVVVAAGNSGADACNYSPARVPEAITVAATDLNDSRANYSNFGSCVDLFAPGSGINSAWINGVNGSAVGSGTSMASPHVAGAVARFLYINPTSTPYQTSNSIVLSSTQGTVQNSGASTPNRLLYFDIAFDSTAEPITASKPSKKKLVNPGRGNKP